MMLPPQSTPASQLLLLLLLQLLHCCTLRCAGKQMPQPAVSECGTCNYRMQFEAQESVN